MKPYSVELPDGSRADVINKLYGRRRSVRLLFFKIKRRKTLIAYSVQVPSQGNVQYTFYKVKNTGSWTKGGERIGRRFNRVDQQITLQIKNAIDRFESATSPWAYRDLFWQNS